MRRAFQPDNCSLDSVLGPGVSAQLFVAAQIDNHSEDRFGSISAEIRCLRHVRLTPTNELMSDIGAS